MTKNFPCGQRATQGKQLPRSILAYSFSSREVLFGYPPDSAYGKSPFCNFSLFSSVPRPPPPDQAIITTQNSARESPDHRFHIAQRSIMATPEVLPVENDLLLSPPLFDHSKGSNAKSRGLAIEKKIELLEGLFGKVSNRRSRRWINDRLLMELVPRLDAEEIRGLFAPPPWGEEVPQSVFSKTNVRDWDKFRHIDMDKEATMLKAFERSSTKRKGRMDADKMAVLSAWHRVDCRTREALRRSFLSSPVNEYEERIRAFIKDGAQGHVLVLQVGDPFHRLLLHGICEFYNLVSVTISQSKGSESSKTTTIKQKKSGPAELPDITIRQFLKMAKEGIW